MGQTAGISFMSIWVYRYVQVTIGGNNRILICSNPVNDLTEKDLEYLRPFTLKVITHMPGETFTKLPYAFPNANIASWKKIQTCIAQLSGFMPELYNCCINSCCCFVGPHNALDACPYCQESCRNAQSITALLLWLAINRRWI